MLNYDCKLLLTWLLFLQCNNNLGEETLSMHLKPTILEGTGNSSSRCVSHTILGRELSKVRMFVLDNYNPTDASDSSTITATNTVRVGSNSPSSSGTILVSSTSPSSSSTTSSTGTTVGLTSPSGTSPPCHCSGAGHWKNIVSLNMSDPDQHCPSNWNLITMPVRGCGRSTEGSSSCDTVIYPVNGLAYSSVCGRIYAIQKGYSYEFYGSSITTIEQSKISGVTITYGPASNKKHIWTFAGANTQYEPNGLNAHLCPCSSNSSSTQGIPEYINNDYFCESGCGYSASPEKYCTEDTLWDGQQCGPYSTCCSFNNPPWFCKTLDEPTNDDLEVSLCYRSPSYYENKIITQVDIYVKTN